MNIFITLQILKKELQSELRIKSNVTNVILFSLYITVMVVFAIGNTIISPDLLAVFLWLILFFSAFAGLSNVFTKEEDFKTLTLIKLSVHPLSIFWGKCLYNIILFFFIELVVITLFLIFLDVKVLNIWYFIIILFLGGMALSISLTVVGAIISKIQQRSAIYSILGLPIVLPLLITVVSGTNLSLYAPDNIHYNEVAIIIGYLVIMITITHLLFEFIWYD